MLAAKAGYMFAARGPELLARSIVGPVKWTHGALTSEATLGMLMTDLPGVAGTDRREGASRARVPAARGGQSPRTSRRPLR